MRRQAFLLAILLSAFFYGYTQNKKSSYPSLLWRITGNHLSTPSYLYGTMHLTDKRLFYFSDSLYHALEKTDGFAAELDMNEIVPAFVEQADDKDFNEKYIAEILTNEELEPVKKKLESIFKKSLKEITVDEVRQAKMKIVSELLSEGDMETITDYYLYGIAEQQGKWVGGIEDPEDQFKALNNKDQLTDWIGQLIYDRKESRKMIDWMIGVYLAQDLDKIDRGNSVWKGSADTVLNRRNIKMARRIDSILQVRSCLFAVGAAHIPGDNGLVVLLRKRGFTVEPVFSKNTIAPESYHFEKKEKRWYPVSPSGNWFTVMMPGKPSPFPGHAENDNFRMYMDLSKSNYYFTISFLTGPSNITPDSQMNAMVHRFSSKVEVLSQKDIFLHGEKGKEILLKSAGEDFRLQVFLPAGKSMIMNMFGSSKKDSLYGSEANRFFNSLTIQPNIPDPVKGTWNEARYEHLGFATEIPGKFIQVEIKLEDSTWKNYQFFLNPPGFTQISLWVFVQSAKSGFYISADSLDFYNTGKSLEEYAKTKAEYEKDFRLDGFPGHEYRYITDNEEGKLKLIARLVHRGNRRYFYYAAFENNEENAQVAMRFMDSFKFLPYKTISWKLQTSPEGEFDIWGPQRLTTDRSDSANPNYQLYDSVEANGVIIRKAPIGKYQYWKNDSLFFRAASSKFETARDSTVEWQLFPVKNGRALYGRVKGEDSHNDKVYSLYLFGDTLYEFFGFLPQTSWSTPNYQRLFREVSFRKGTPVSTAFQSKSKQLLTDLLSKDTVIAEQANVALMSYEFEQEDLPALKEALLQHYDGSENYFSTYPVLVRKTMALKDSSLTDWVKDHFDEVVSRHPDNQYQFLRLLSQTTTKESYAALKTLMLDNGKRVPGGDASILQYGILDSLALTASLFPEWLELAKDTNRVRLLVDMLPELIDSGIVKVKQLQPYKKFLYAHIDKKLAEINSKATEEDYFSITAESNLLALLKEPAALQRLQKMAMARQSDVAYQALSAQIEHQIPTDSRVINRMAADIEFRHSLYQLLEDKKKLTLFPAKYATRAALAESEIYSWDDEETPSKVSFLAEKNIRLGGKLQRWLICKVAYKNEEGGEYAYLAFIGPYANKQLVTDDNGFVRFVYDIEYNGKNLQEIIDAFIKKWGKDGVNDED